MYIQFLILCHETFSVNINIRKVSWDEFGKFSEVLLVHINDPQLFDCLFYTVNSFCAAFSTLFSLGSIIFHCNLDFTSFKTLIVIFRPLTRSTILYDEWILLQNFVVVQHMLVHPCKLTIIFHISVFRKEENTYPS